MYLLDKALEYNPTKKLIAAVEALPISNMINMDSTLKKATHEVNWFEKHSCLIINWIKKRNLKKLKPSIGNTEMYRLPGNIKPESYELHFAPNITDAKFTGSVVIYATVEKDCHEIILHSNNLRFGKKDVTVEVLEDGNTSDVLILGLRYCQKYHFNYISLDEHLDRGSRIRINITNYEGILNSETRGRLLTRVKSLPITYDVWSPTEIKSIFDFADDLSVKAASLIRMVESLMGENNFYKALNKYLTNKLVFKLLFLTRLR